MVSNTALAWLGNGDVRPRTSSCMHDKDAFHDIANYAFIKHANRLFQHLRVQYRKVRVILFL